MHNPPANGRRYAAPIDPDPALGLSTEATEGEHVVSIRDVLRVIRKRILIILSVATLLTGLAVVYSFLQTPMYQSTIKILVGQESGITCNPSDVGGLEQLTKTMAEAVNSRPVNEGVIQRLNLQMTPGDFSSRVNVQQIVDTQFVQVDYRDSSPERAQQVVDTIGDVFSEQVSGVPTFGVIPQFTLPTGEKRVLAGEKRGRD